MTISQIFSKFDNPRPKFPFDDDPVDLPEADYDCPVCKRLMSEHDTREIVKCALVGVRGKN